MTTNTKVRLRAKGHADLATGQIRNISLGGVFVHMEHPLSFGTEVELEFSLPAEPHQIRCRGFVVWSTKGSAGKKPREQGVGIRLTDIGVQQMRMLAEYIDTQLAGVPKTA